MSLVTGTVTLSLAEVDNLRNQITEKEAKVTELTKELQEVRSDKRMMKLTEYVGLKKEDYLIKIDEYGIRHAINNYRAKLDPFNNTTLDRFITVIPSPSIKERQIEFVNFDDVKIEIRNQIEKNYENEILSLKTEVRKLTERLHDLTNSNTSEINSLIRKHDEEVKKLTNKITELETGKIEQTEIEELQGKLHRVTEHLLKTLQDLSIEKGKKWYHKLLNLK